ncbi:hypothetical protein [Paraburkholderia strydomiana]|uniref:hypothetical protein n=1 Tax=Paraburkholderia strydomiana TaxID=1245417 RepID=UPI0038B6B67E
MQSLKQLFSKSVYVDDRRTWQSGLTAFCSETRLKSDTVGIARAYLETAGVAAMVMQAGALVSIEIFGTNEAASDTLQFRLSVSRVILASVLTVRFASDVVFVRMNPTFVVQTGAYGDILAHEKWSPHCQRFTMCGLAPSSAFYIYRRDWNRTIDSRRRARVSCFTDR